MMTGKARGTDAGDVAAEVRSRYGDVVKAAERARAAGDSERADELIGTARAILERDKAAAVAQHEMDNYARGSFRADDKPTAEADNASSEE
jgi:hypothetical protein